MAKIKDFLLELENDPQLLRDYRGKRNKRERKELAKSRGGLSDQQADTLQSDDLATIRAAIEQEDGGGQLFFVVMLA